jgi:hypothetical protein
MNYLTNYYKNLSEQLQEKVNFLEQQINELYILDPNQKFAPTTMATAVDTASMRRGQSARRADVLGQMHALATYHGASDDEKAAIARIMADTQQSTPASAQYRSGNYSSYAPSARQSGSAATQADVRTALQGIRSRAADPGFAQHVTDVVSPTLTPTVIDRAEMADSMEDYPMFGAKARARLTAVSDRSAQNLTPSAVPSEITKEFGERMFQYFPGERRTLGDREYSQYVPADIVTKMVRGNKPKS